MKLRMTFVALFCILALGLSGCSNGDNKGPKEVTTPDSLKQGFSCEADIRYGGMDIRINLTRPSLQECIIEVTDPSPLTGLKLHWQGQDLTMSYMGLNLDLVEEMFPDTSFATAINNAFSSIAGMQSMQMSEENGQMTFSGMSDSGEFSVTMDMQTGKLQNLSVPSLDLEVEFKSFSAY